jgi:hypothetical protein
MACALAASLESLGRFDPEDIGVRRGAQPSAGFAPGVLPDAVLLALTPHRSGCTMGRRHRQPRSAPRGRRLARRHSQEHTAMRVLAAAALVLMLVLAAPAGASTTVAPGDDLQAAIDNATPEPGQDRAVVRLTEGVYDLTETLFVENAVDLVGQGELPEDVVLRATNSISFEAVVVGLDASLQNLSVVLSETYNGEVFTLVQMSSFGEGTVELRRVRVDGFRQSNGVDSLAVQVAGGTRFQAQIIECQIRNCADGVWSSSSGVNITRTQFDGLDGDAVTALGAEVKQSGVDVPLLGLPDEVETTGLNTFQQVDGNFVTNNTDTEIEAANNDWGLENPAEIQAKVAGAVDTMQFVTGPTIGPGSVVVAVVDGNNDPVPNTANPTCTITTLGIQGTRDPSSQNFVFSGVTTGVQTVQANATGFPSRSAQVTVNAAAVASVTLQLANAPGGGGGCGKDGTVAYAAAMLLVVGAGRRYRRRRQTR